MDVKIVTTIYVYNPLPFYIHKLHQLPQEVLPVPFHPHNPQQRSTSTHTQAVHHQQVLLGSSILGFDY